MYVCAIYFLFLIIIILVKMSPQLRDKLTQETVAANQRTLTIVCHRELEKQKDTKKQTLMDDMGAH